MTTRRTLTPDERGHPGDAHAIEMLIAAGVFSPAARSMHVPQLASQHNGANAVDAGDDLFIYPDQPLSQQVDRIISAHRSR